MPTIGEDKQIARKGAMVEMLLGGGGSAPWEYRTESVFGVPLLGALRLRLSFSFPANA